MTTFKRLSHRRQRQSGRNIRYTREPKPQPQPQPEPIAKVVPLYHGLYHLPQLCHLLNKAA